MTIGRGLEWGERVERPDQLRVVRSDRDLAQALTDGSAQATSVVGGDLLKTIGGATPPGDRTVLRAPIDLIEVRLDDSPVCHAAAHVFLRVAIGRGGPLRGPVVMVMNAEFMGAWDVAPRGHPNVGRLVLLSCETSLGVRQRLAVRKRLATGTHLPHPEITARSVTAASWSFDRPVAVVSDGCRVGRARDVEIRVLPDAAVLYV
jgi:hypothetical protein